MTDEEKVKELQEENQKLKERLTDFKQLEEDLLADKVFKKAKDKLVSWYTIGGISVFGYRNCWNKSCRGLLQRISFPKTRYLQRGENK